MLFLFEIRDAAPEVEAVWAGIVRLGCVTVASRVVKATAVLGVLLIVLGILALTYQGITYTRREKVLEIGPIEATKETEKTIPLPPIVGGVAVIGGVVLLLGARRRGGV